MVQLLNYQVSSSGATISIYGSIIELTSIELWLYKIDLSFNYIVMVDIFFILLYNLLNMKTYYFYFNIFRSSVVSGQEM